MEPKIHHLKKFTRLISKESGKHKFLIFVDLIYSSVRFGVKFAEYYNMDFVNRSMKNRQTFITTHYNFKIYDKINKKEYRNNFHNKKEFNRLYSKFILRKWIDIDKTDIDEFTQFVKDVNAVVIKKSYGDSGAGVEFISDVLTYGEEKLYNYCKKNRFDLVEEAITNHEDVKKFNETSLNTVRIVSVTNGEDVKILYAGLRVGAKGSRLDNISQGGAVANIDVDTGKISGEFFGKKNTASTDGLIGHNYTGYQLPYWRELVEMTKDMARYTSNIHYVAWDIAITPDGPEIIEGNESFGSVVMQADRGPREEGLKPRLENILRELKINI